MSFYSALVLAANEAVRVPTRRAVHSLLRELGLVQPAPASGEFGNLAVDITALFDDASARGENAYFFCPDSISFTTPIEIHSPDEEFEGPGWCIQIHGNGYFFPWGLPDLRERVVGAPKLRRLRQTMRERFGGRFVYPAGAEAVLRERWIDGEAGWIWFGSESL